MVCLQVVQLYKEAVEINADADTAYVELTNMYLGQERYDDAIAWLDTGGFANAGSLKDKCRMTRVWRMMENSDYAGLLQFFKGDAVNIDLSYVRYFQNGEIQETIVEGTGMILSQFGVYMGEIRDNLRSGNGRQFGTFTILDTMYTLTDGPWSDNMANGQCTYMVVDQANERNNCTITGNVVNNLFHGDMTLDELTDDGPETFKAHAENGVYTCIRIEDQEKYVYAESISGIWYLSYLAEEHLHNNGIWSAY